MQRKAVCGSSVQDLRVSSRSPTSKTRPQRPIAGGSLHHRSPPPPVFARELVKVPDLSAASRVTKRASVHFTYHSHAPRPGVRSICAQGSMAALKFRHRVIDFELDARRGVWARGSG